MSEQENQSNDPCALTPAGRWAMVWAFCVILGASILACKLCRIDRMMYSTGAPVLDMAAYKENRAAFTSIASENFDARRQPGFHSKTK